ncbi:GNAT family N-acetyltransferase [Microbacterium sp. NPDC057650]|uniref:GNAT family N-acetyltransferase n=1 Tax=unclassified Microbacterium TaxID=2609290 RepID=UPI00366D2E21
MPGSRDPALDDGAQPSPYTRDHAEGFVELIAQWWADGSQAIWGIYAEDALVGVVGLHHITDSVGGGHAELGYWMAAPQRGRGYLVEASRAAVDWAFAELDLARLNWRAVVGNVPSARAARALGFRYEGMQRQALTSERGRDDGWVGGLLATDDRTPVRWPVL